MKHKFAICIALSLASGCGTDPAAKKASNSGAMTSEMPETTESMDGGDATAPTLCAKYGGADVVASVVQNNVIGAIAEDCRINTFFTTLTPEGFNRVNDCLTIQVQELFGCDDVQYAGSESSDGLPCRDMKEAHSGLKISNADFDALIEDVVAGLTEAGVAEADIGAAAPALLGMEPDIVEVEGEENSRLMCTPAESDAGAE